MSYRLESTPLICIIISEMREEIMTKLILPPQVEERFQHLTQTVEVCNDTGSVLGRFTPVASDDEAGQTTVIPIVSAKDLRIDVASDQQTTIRVLHFWQC